jgi:hypothetical protein
LHFGVAQYPITQLSGINWEAIRETENHANLNDFLVFAGIPDEE